MQVVDSAPQFALHVRPQGVALAEVDVMDKLECLLAQLLRVCDNDAPVILLSEPVFIRFE
jgi:hypothetical protein